MGEYKNKTYPLRIDNELRLKVEYIAKIEDRKISQQYERIIKNFISTYEDEHGELIVNENGTVTPKKVSNTNDNHLKVRSSISKTG
jgi:hypothetical protein